MKKPNNLIMALLAFSPAGFTADASTTVGGALGGAACAAIGNNKGNHERETRTISVAWAPAYREDNRHHHDMRGVTGASASIIMGIMKIIGAGRTGAFPRNVCLCQQGGYEKRHAELLKKMPIFSFPDAIKRMAPMFRMLTEWFRTLSNNKCCFRA